MKFERMADSPNLFNAGSPIGSKPWAEHRKKELEQAIDSAIAGRIRFSSELVDFWQTQAWQLFTDKTDEPFRSFYAFARAQRPYGLGCTEDDYNALMDAAKRTVQDFAEQYGDEPLPSASESHQGNNSAWAAHEITITKNDFDNIKNDFRDSKSGGTSSEYLTRRIARDRPDIIKRMKDGEFASVRAAAKEAGIVKDNFQMPKDAAAAGRYLAQRVDSEWMLACYDAFMKSIEGAGRGSL
jgi:hypothetical protein